MIRSGPVIASASRPTIGRSRCVPTPAGRVPRGAARRRRARRCRRRTCRAVRATSVPDRRARGCHLRGGFGAGGDRRGRDRGVVLGGEGATLRCDRDRGLARLHDDPADVRHRSGRRRVDGARLSRGVDRDRRRARARRLGQCRRRGKGLALGASDSEVRANYQHGLRWGAGIEVQGGAGHVIAENECRDDLCAIKCVETVDVRVERNRYETRWFGIHLVSAESSSLYRNRRCDTMRAVTVEGGTGNSRREAARRTLRQRCRRGRRGHRDRRGRLVVPRLPRRQLLLGSGPRPRCLHAIQRPA